MEAAAARGRPWDIEIFVSIADLELAADFVAGRTLVSQPAGGVVALVADLDSVT